LVAFDHKLSIQKKEKVICNFSRYEVSILMYAKGKIAKKYSLG